MSGELLTDGSTLSPVAGTVKRNEGSATSSCNERPNCGTHLGHILPTMEFLCVTTRR